MDEKLIQAINADMDDLKQDLAICALGAIDRGRPEGGASVKTFVRKSLDLYLFCTDGLCGMMEAIQAAYPKRKALKNLLTSSNCLWSGKFIDQHKSKGRTPQYRARSGNFSKHMSRRGARSAFHAFVTTLTPHSLYN